MTVYHYGWGEQVACNTTAIVLSVYRGGWGAVRLVHRLTACTGSMLTCYHGGVLSSHTTACDCICIAVPLRLTA